VPEVLITLDVPGPAGNVHADDAWIRATPTRRRTVGDAIVLPVAFTVPVPEGVTTVELAATGTDWCWRIEELTGARATRYVAVPDVAGPIGYEDLVDVDPATLDPAAEPEAAWTLAQAALAARVTALEEGAVTVGPDVVKGVDVETGEEPRPEGVNKVIWHDFREDFSVPPTNIGLKDIWLTPVVEDEEPPPSEAFSVYGAVAPTGAWELGTDGAPYIVVGRGFYKFDSSHPTNGLPTGRVVGGRAWLPAAGVMPTEATFTLHGPNVGLDSAAVQSKVVAIPADPESSWVEGLFDTPQDMGDDADVWMIGVRFTGAEDAGKYVAGTGTRTNSDAVVSTSGKNIAWAEQSGPNAALSSQFKIGTGAAQAPPEQTNSEGVDILVDEGA